MIVMDKHEALIVKLEKKKARLESQLEDIDEQIEQAIKDQKSYKFDVMRKKYKDLIEIVKNFYEAEEKMYELIPVMKEIKNEAPCYDCEDWEDTANDKLCPFAAFCCWHEGDNGHPDEPLEWIKKCLDREDNESSETYDEEGE